MYSDDDTPKGWVAPFGHPRIKACSRLPMAFRSVPRPSSPPGAKASTECPYRAPYAPDPSQKRPASATMHRNHRRQPARRPARTPVRCTLTQLYSALTQTPLNTAAPSGWTTLGAATPRSLPVRQVTQRTTDHPAQTQPAQAQPNHNRVVLRAQRRTRTRFTTQKNKPPGTRPAAARHAAHPTLSGATTGSRSRIHPMKHSKRRALPDTHATRTVILCDNARWRLSDSNR